MAQRFPTDFDGIVSVVPVPDGRVSFCFPNESESRDGRPLP
jgi:hypothetical protein